MHLVVDSLFRQQLQNAIEKFSARRPTVLLEHPRACCVAAKAWFVAMDRTMSATHDMRGAPTWLRSYFQWGPSRWTLAWCQVVRRPTLECGVLAALARESYKVRDTPVQPAQLVRLHSEQEADHWRATWRVADCPTDWIHGPFVFHEALALVEDHDIRVWDPVCGFWVDPELRSTYMGTVAIRVVSNPPQMTGAFKWAGRCLRPNSWESILD